MVDVAVQPSVLLWALRRSGRDVSEVSGTFPRWTDWVERVRQPTLNQVEALAQFTGVPFGFFFLNEPAEAELPIADFRDGYQSRQNAGPSTELLEVVYQSQRRQDWYRDYAQRLGLPEVEFVGTTSTDAAPESVARQLREMLRFEAGERAGRTLNDTRKYLLDRCEALGVLTVCTSMVENNTHRLLNPDEFRGFSLSDRHAPLVFVNAADTLNGQIFSIAHEMAHLFLGTSGVSGDSHDTRRADVVEVWCNAVASDFLVPAEDLRKIVPVPVTIDDLPIVLGRLADRYKCGTLVALIGLRDARRLRVKDFERLYQDTLSDLRSAAANQQGGRSGGSFYLNQPYRIGRRLSTAIRDDATEGNTTLSEAMSLTSLKSLSTWDKWAREVVE